MSVSETESPKSPKAIDDHPQKPKPMYGDEDTVGGGLSDSITTTSDGGSSLMTPDFLDDEVSSYDSNACDDIPTRSHSKSETLLIFDYDDTLFPTSYLAQHGYRLDGPDASPEIQKVLDDYSFIVEQTLMEARHHGQVIILTNAETGWIELTSQKFMPRLSDLLDSFPLFSARSTYEPLGISSPFQWKLRAFENVICDHYSMMDSGTIRRKNVLSFGDSIHERDAAHQVCAKLARTVCKSVKFMERPDVAQLGKQHALIRDCFAQIVAHNGTLDLCIQCQAHGSE
jgi:hypothetical protein